MQPNCGRLFTANGGSVQIYGTARLRIQNQNNEIVSTVIVAENMSHPALISWHDLMSLKIISPQFPALVAQLDSTSLREETILKYPKVFQDRLTEVPMFTDPVHIHLKDGATPFRVSAARQIPLRFREPAEICVQELVKKGVITPCHLPTEWCSPAFFVVKADGKSVRMVTDYTCLYQHVKRPVHPFSCVTEILQV